MARPPFEGNIYRYRVTLCLREGEHDDLIAALRDVDNRAQTVITIMRHGLGERDAASADDVDEAAASAALDNLLF